MFPLFGEAQSVVPGNRRRSVLDVKNGNDFFVHRAIVANPGQALPDAAPDGQKNTRAASNENLARELMELFAIGIGSGYAEADVRDGACALTALAGAQPGESAARARAAACFADLRSVDEMIGAVHDAPAAEETEPDGEAAPATATGGARTPLEAHLDLVAQCVEAGVATRVFSVSLGGFDTASTGNRAGQVAHADHRRRLTDAGPPVPVGPPGGPAGTAREPRSVCSRYARQENT
ncbi:DUF1800 family protein [Micromonospora marina]|uniref:DUF1800 family protein n=1 Tax=Micromonospora marina TaxID=307120 RepID=UPI003F502145